jgi:hypothetical protein
MRETIEFRISEELAKAFLEPGLGTPIGYGVIKVVLPIEDARVKLIGDLNREFSKSGRAFFSSWQIFRRYTRSEMEAAELFQLFISSTFEPEGERLNSRTCTWMRGAFPRRRTWPSPLQERASSPPSWQRFFASTALPARSTGP